MGHAESGPFNGCSVLNVFTGEEAGCHWAEYTYPHPFLSAQWKQFIFAVSSKQVVGGLNAIPAGQIELITDPERLAELKGTKIGTAKVSYLSLPDQVVHGSKGFL
jgi:hypothetical protein